MRPCLQSTPWSPSLPSCPVLQYSKEGVWLVRTIAWCVGGRNGRETQLLAPNHSPTCVGPSWSVADGKWKNSKLCNMFVAKKQVFSLSTLILQVDSVGFFLPLSVILACVQYDGENVPSFPFSSPPSPSRLVHYQHQTRKRECRMEGRHLQFSIHRPFPLPSLDPPPYPGLSPSVSPPPLPNRGRRQTNFASATIYLPRAPHSADPRPSRPTNVPNGRLIISFPRSPRLNEA